MEDAKSNTLGVIFYLNELVLSVPVLNSGLWPSILFQGTTISVEVEFCILIDEKLVFHFLKKFYSNV